jgi:VCBS repeat-containing protein/CshA-type fibril repeat protein
VTETATVNVTINPMVDIADDVVVTDEDTAVTTDVLANDSFEGSPVVSAVTQGAHGTVVNNNDGTITYTPNADYNGSDSYTYTVTSPTGVTETATVNVTINPMVDIADDVAVTDEDTAVTTDVLANDNFEGSPVVSAVTQGAHGTVVNNNDGTVTYTPDGDYNGSDSYTYTVTSPTGVTETATVNVTINPVVDIVDDIETTDEDTAVTTDVLANDSFEGSPVVSAVTQGAHGTVVNNNDGTVTYTPDGDYNGSDSYTYTVTSPTGVTETATVNVTINPMVDIADDVAVTDEDTAVTTDVLANDSFEGSPVVSAVTQGAHGTVVNNNDGTITYTPNADYNGSDSYTYTVTSPTGVTETATVTVTINPVVDIVDDTETTDEDTAVTTDVLANDNFEGSPVVSAVTQGAHGTVVNNNDGTVTYTPNADYNGSDSYTYTVTSPTGVTETATVTVTINPVVDIVDDTETTDEDTAVTTDVLGNDNFEGSPLVTGVTQGAHGAVVNNNDGTVTYTPDADYNGSDSYTYTVTSPTGVTETAMVNVTINPVTDLVADSVTTNSTGALTFDPLSGSNGGSADNFENPAAVIAAIGSASHGSAVLNPADGTITYTPTPGYVGPDSFSYTVTSGGVSETATISVIVTNVAPVGNPDSASTAEDTPVSGNVLDSDTDSDPGDSKMLIQFVVDSVTVPVQPGAVGGSTTIAGVGTLTLKADGSYSFTPLADWNGNVPTVTYTLSDVAGATATATFDITVTPVADITADSVTTNSTAGLTFNPLAGTNGATADNFEDRAAAISAIGSASHGSAVLNPDGTITYTPTPGYVGPDSFSYTVTSGGIDETATISVIVTNAAPVGSPDIASTPEDTPVSGNVLDNDTDSDPDDSKTLTHFVVDGVTVPVPPGAVGGSTTIAGVGTLTLKADGSYSFTPVADWNGNVPTVTYTLSDVAGATATATLNITVTPVADITADSVTTNSTAAITFNPLAGTNGASADNFEDPAAAISAIGDASHGSAVLNPDGTITYTPTPGYVGSDSFSYTVSSGGIDETATINVTVTNAAPIAAPDIASTPEDTLLTGNLLSNDSDPDSGDSLSVSQFVVDGVTVAVPAGPTGGSTLIAGVGTLTVRADGSYTFSPLADWNGNVPTVSYSIRDIAGTTASSSLSIAVGGVNDPPMATADAYDTTDSAGPPGGTPISGNVLLNDSDPDAGTVLQVVAINAGAGSVGGDTGGTFGSLTLNADGTFSYAVDQGNATVVTLQRGESLTETFSYTISDGDGGRSTATLVFTIHGTNDAPSAGNDRNAIVEDQVSASGNVISGARVSGGGVSSTDLAARDIDPNGDPLTITEIRLPDDTAGSIGAPFAGQFGSIKLDAGGDYVYALNNANPAVQALHAGETLTDHFVYTTSDGRGSFVDATITITLTGTNDAPLAVADVNSISEDAPNPVTGNVLLNDSDVDNNSARSVTAVSAASPGAVDGNTTGRFGTLSLNADGSYSYRLDNSNGAVQALGVGRTLSDIFAYTASDGEGGSASSTLTITINGTNDAPLAVGVLADQQDNDHTVAAVDVSGGFGDVDLGDALAFAASGLPAGLNIEHSTGVISGTLDRSASQGGPASNGVYNVVVTVTDTHGASVTQSFTWTVSNPAPIATDNHYTAGEDDAPAALGNALTDAVADSDADGDTLSAAVVSNAAGSSGGLFSVAANGTISFDPNGAFEDLGAGQTRDSTYTYTLIDADGGSDTATITVAVSGVNDAPVAAPDIASTPEDTLLTGNLLGNDSDPDAGDSLTVTRFVVDGVTVDVPAGAVGGSTLIAGIGTLTVKADGSYSFNPLTNWNGNVPTVSYSIRDSAGATASSSLSITVGGVNDPPTANDDNYDTTDTAGPPGGTPISGNVLGNDSDPDAGTALQVVAIDGGAGSIGGDTAGSFGSLTLNADGSFAYAVDPGNATVVSLQRGDSLTETFSYTITDGEGATSSATITFTIHGTNDAPSAGNDRNSIAEEQASASGNVISGAKISGGGVSSTDLAARDIDPNGDPLTVTEIRLPDNTAGVGGGAPLAGQFGNITLDVGGDYVYALDNANPAVQALHDGETLTDHFVYTTSDGRGSLVDATITITITGTNDAPLAVADINRISEDSPNPVSGNVLLNDSDVDGNSTLRVSAVSGAAPGAVNGNTSGSFGTLMLNVDGSYSYRLDNSNSAVQALAVGQTLTDAFAYTAADGEGGSASTTLTITIDGENDAPLAHADTASVAEDTLLTGNVLSNDSDPDSGDRLTVTQFVVDGVTVAVPAGAVGGSATIVGVGTLTLTADGDYRFTPQPDWNGSVPTVTYSLRDTAGAIATSSLDITVTPVADSTADSVTTSSSAVLVFDPMAGTNGATADSFEDPAAAITAIGAPAHGSAVLNPDGTISYTPRPGFVGADSFSYTVSSGGVSETATISIAVSNAAPTARPDIGVTPEDTPLSGNVLSNDTDSDPGDRLTVTQFVVDGVTVAVPAGAVGGSTTIAGVGTLTLTADGDYRFTPKPDWNGSVPSVTYSLRDTAGATTTSRLDITVTPVADSTADSVTTNSTGVLAFDPLTGTNGATADNFEDPAAAISAIGAPAHGSAVLNPDGTITYTPVAGYVGADSFSYTVSSGGVSETATISIAVSNAAPIARPDIGVTLEDTPLSGNVLSNDSDSDPGDSKTVIGFVVDGVSVAVPAGSVGASTAIAGVGQLTFKADGSYRFNPLADWNGRVPPVTYTVRDTAGATASSSLTITVIPVPDSRVPPYVLQTFDLARWLDVDLIDRIIERLEQPFIPAQYVLQQVGRAQDSLAEAVAALLGVYEVRQHGELRSLIRDFYQTMTPAQFVLDQGVGFSHELLAELQQRALLGSRMAIGGESLYDDFSIFSPLRIAANSGGLVAGSGIVFATADLGTVVEPAAVPDLAKATKVASAARAPSTLMAVAATESEDGIERGAGKGSAADGLLPPVPSALRATPAAAARSFSEQLRQSQSERRRVPLV